MLCHSGLLAQFQGQALVGFTTNNLVVQERDGAVSVFVFRRGNPDGTNSLSVSGTTGTGVDSPITFETTPLVFTPGMSLIELVLPIQDNDLRGPNRTLNLQFTAITPRTFITNRYNTLLITIPDDDAMTFRLATNAVIAREDSTNASIDIIREGNSRVAASVELQLADPVSPPNPRNTLYLVNTQRIDFAVSETRRSVNLPLRALPTITGPSSARILLRSPSTPLATFASPSNATLTVLDIDGTLALASTNLWLPTETNRVLIPVTKNGIPAVSGFLALEDGTAREGEDFNGRRIPFTIPESTNTISIEVPLLDNPARVHGRWFRAVLQSVEALEPATSIIRIWIPPSASASATPSRFLVDSTVSSAGFPTNLLAIAPGPDNSWYLGGAFPPSLGSAASNILRITRTFAPAPAWAPSASPNGTIQYAAALPDGRLFVGGNFTTWGDSSRTGLALLLPDGNLAPTGNSLDVTNVTALIPDARGRIYVSGSFNQISGLDAPGLARFSSTGDLEVFFRPISADYGSFSSFAPLAPEGVALARPDGSVAFLNDAGASNAIVSAPSPFAGPTRLTPLPDGSLRLSTQQAHITSGGSADTEVATQLNSAEQIWSVPSGAIYSSIQNEMGWRLTRHWGDGTPDPRMEVWFDGAITRITEAADGTLLVSGAFTRADGLACTGIAQLLPPSSKPGIRWHAGTGFTIGERARYARIPAWRESGLESAAEIAIPIPPSSALASGVPSTLPLRFDAGSRMGWLTVPLRDQTEAGPDLGITLTLPDAQLTPGAPASVDLKIFRDEQTFGFAESQVVIDETVPPPFSSFDLGSRPHLAVRRLTGVGFAGSTVARFAGGTVNPQIAPYPTDALYAGAFDFFASTGDIPLVFPAGISGLPLLVGPYDDDLSQGDRLARFTLDGPGPVAGLQATLMVRDNDRQGPAEIPGRSIGYQSTDGFPYLFNNQGTLDGRTSRAARINAPDGAPLSGPVVQRSGDTLLYIGPGPAGSHYFQESTRFSPGSGQQIRLVRHLATGSPDPAFNPISFPSSFFVSARTAPTIMSQEGSMFVLTREHGAALPIGPSTYARILRKYGNDGLPVPGYKPEIYTRPATGSSVILADEAILLPYPDGSLLVIAGGALSTNGIRKDVIRILPSGAYDLTYRARLTLDSTFSPRINSALLDPSGRCVLLGQFNRVDGIPRPGFARLTSTGRIDEGFDPRFLTNYPGQTLVSLRNLPGGRLLVALSTQPRSTVFVLDDSGNPDPAVAPVEFDGWVAFASPAADGAIVVAGDFHTVQGQTRHNEAWFDTKLRLLGTAPLTLRFNDISPTSTQLTLDARAAGTVTVERGNLDGVWQSVGETPVLPGANSITIPTPSGDRWFLRAIRR